MAKKSPANQYAEVSKPNEDLTPILTKLSSRIDELEVDSDKQTQLLKGFKDHIDAIEKSINKTLEKIESRETPIAVTSIDPNKNFQDCISMALQAMIQHQNVNVLLNPPVNQSHLDQLIDSTIILGETFHAKLCEKFAIE